MIQLILAACLIAPAPMQDEGPDPKVVERAVQELEEGLKSREAEKRSQAIVQNSEVAAPEVVRLIARGLRDKEREVQEAAIGALRYNDHASALDALHDSYKRNRGIRKDPELYANLIRAIGQHQSPSSIGIVADDSLSSKYGAVVAARVYSLGNIRHRDSAEALFQLIRTAGRKEIQPYMGHVRLSLMLLTGVDQGESQDRWMSWWNDNKKDFEVAPKAPRLPGAMQRRWEGYWGLQRTYDRPERRDDRGNDPEKGGGE